MTFWTLLAAIAAAVGVVAAFFYGYLNAVHAGFEAGFRKGVEAGTFEALRTVRQPKGDRVRKSAGHADGDAA